MVATQKNKSELSEVKEVRSKAAEVKTGEGNVLAALTEQVAYLMDILDTKSSSSCNQKIERDNKTK